MNTNTSCPFAVKPIAAAVALASASVAVPGLASQPVIEEIVVTATRRESSMQEIPYNISAVTGESIRNAGTGSLADLMKLVPGVVFADFGMSGNSQSSSIVLRGLNVQQQSDGSTVANLAVPTVSTYMDETPVYLNLKMIDIQRVEVLRGPQGTLYGSGSLAGTLRFIHNRPDTTAFGGSIAGGVESFADSDGLNYTVDGVLNVPVSDRVALRLAATLEDDAGVFDAVGVNLRDATGAPMLADPTDFIGSPAATRDPVDDADQSEVYGIRTSLVWNINDAVEAFLVYHNQHQQSEGFNARDGFQSSSAYNAAFVREFEQDLDIFSAELNAELGFATLTSSSSYSDAETDQTRNLGRLMPILDALDLSGFGGPTQCNFYGCFPRHLFLSEDPASRQQFTQEIRLVSNPDGGSFDWLIGGYYNDEEYDQLVTQTVFGYADWANAPGSDEFVAQGLGLPGSIGLSFADFWLAGLVANPADEADQFFQDRSQAFEELAVYGELTVNVTDAWQTTLGARYFDQRFKSRLFQRFSNCDVFCATDPTDVRGTSDITQTEDATDTIFKFNTSYDFGGKTTLYFTWAQGFRHGGANPLPVGAFGITADAVPYEADETENFELGIKGRLMDGKVAYTMAAYHIGWDNPQLDVFVSAAGFASVLNAESAESQGIEVEVQANLSPNFDLTLGYTHTDAELTDDFSVGGASGADGDALPGVAEHQATLAVNYSHVLSDTWSLEWHLNAQYKGEAENALARDSAARSLDAFALVNGSVSLLSNDWSVTLFVNNLFDEDDAIYAYNAFQDWESVARPRSFGLRASYEF